MPIPSPGTYDQAAQTTLLAVKASTDIIGASVALEGGGNLAAVKVVTDEMIVYNLESGSNLATSGSWTVVPTNLANLIDNNDATATGEGTNGNDSIPSYINIDMVLLSSIIEVVYNYNSHYTTTGSGGGFVFIDVSNDNVTWRRIYTSPNLPAGDTNYSGNISIGRMFRYLRLGLFANTIGNTYTGYLTGKEITITGMV